MGGRRAFGWLGLEESINRVVVSVVKGGGKIGYFNNEY